MNSNLNLTGKLSVGTTMSANTSNYNGTSSSLSVGGGKDGINGYTPVKGVDYFDGKDGVNGKSAYESWLELGNIGTEEEFIASLKGEVGPAGEKGDTGLTQEEKDYLFQSVGDGKTLIASAITDKGISTNNDATFQQMATNISNINTSEVEVPNKDTWVKPSDWIDIRNDNESDVIFTLLVDTEKPLNLKFNGITVGVTVDFGDGNTQTSTSMNYAVSYTYDQSVGTLLSNGRRVVKVSVKNGINSTITGVYLDGTNTVNPNVGILWMHFPNPTKELNKNSKVRIYDSYYTSSYMSHKLTLYRLDGYIRYMEIQTSGGKNLDIKSMYSYDDYEANYTYTVGACEYLGSANNIIYTNHYTDLVASGLRTIADGMPLAEIPTVSPIGTRFPIFSYLTYIKSINILDSDIGKTINLTTCFQHCGNLRDVSFLSKLDTSITTMCIGTFQNCYSLKEIPYIELKNATTVINMFSGCRSLVTIPKLNYEKVTNMSDFVSGCKSLLELDISTLTLDLGTNVPSFAYLQSLRKLILPQSWNYNLNVSYTDLNKSELDRIFTELPTVVGKTITITGATGATDCDKTIATAKGWTVV